MSSVELNMNDPHHPAYRISFRHQRSDYVALTMALSRRTALHVLVEMAGYTAVMLAMLWLSLGSLEALRQAFQQLFAGQASLWIYSVVLAGPLFALLKQRLAGLLAAAIYKRNAVANREVTLDFTAQGIEGGVADLYSRIGWKAVKRLIETPSHLFLQISRRQALILPRRAVPDEHSYRALLGFTRARVANLGK